MKKKIKKLFFFSFTILTFISHTNHGIIAYSIAISLLNQIQTLRPLLSGWQALLVTQWEENGQMLFSKKKKKI